MNLAPATSEARTSSLLEQLGHCRGTSDTGGLTVSVCPHCWQRNEPMPGIVPWIDDSISGSLFVERMRLIPEGGDSRLSGLWKTVP